MQVLDRSIIAVDEDALPSAAVARRVWLEFRQVRGFKSATALLTAPDAQPKAVKNVVPTYVLHLAPADLSGVEVCPAASAGCRAACLNSAGRGRFDSVQNGRITKTHFLAEHPAEFLAILRAEILSAVKRHGGHVGIRLNGTSDIRWERFARWLYAIPGATFYDYTKHARRDVDSSEVALTFSVSERDSVAKCLKMAERFERIAVVVDRAKGETIPTTWQGLVVADGDSSDWRFESGPVAVLLRAKGANGKADQSGFVRHADMSAGVLQATC